MLSGATDIDLLFTDMIMPGGLDGAMLAAEARRLRPDLKVLYTTGYAEDAKVLTGEIEQSGHLLRKPYTRADLAKMIRNTLDRTA